MRAVCALEITCNSGKQKLYLLNRPVDIWCVLNPDAKRFTWRKKKPEIHCHLDFFFTSVSLRFIETLDEQAGVIPSNKQISWVERKV